MRTMSNKDLALRPSAQIAYPESSDRPVGRLGRAWRKLVHHITGLSIRYKLLLVVLAVILALGVAVTLQVRNRLVADLSQELETRGLAIARDMADDAEELILTQNIFGLYQELRKGLENNPDVRYVFVLDPNGQVLAHSFPQGVPQDLLQVNLLAPDRPWQIQLLDSDEGRLTDIAMPILEGRLGVVRLGLSHRRLEQAVAAASRELMAITGIVLLLGGLLTWGLTRFITAPILDLVQATRAVGTGDLSVRPSVRMMDEIGELTAAFNAMTADLARFRDELLQQNRELATLNAVAQSISGSRSLEQVLHTALDTICRALDVPAGWILLDEADPQGRPAIVATWGLSNAFVDEETRPDLPECHCYRVMRRETDWRVPVLRHDCPRLARSLERGRAEAALNCHLSVPLMSHDRPLGVLNLAATTSAQFRPEAMELVAAIARQVGVAVDAEQQRQRLLDEMARREALRGQLLERVMAAQEEERRRIARELHDEAGQSLSSLLVGLRMLEDHAEDPQAVVNQARALKQLADGVLEELHRLAMDLRPASLDHVGLVAALQQMVDQVGQTYGIATQFEALGLDGVTVPADVETHIYRIVQEALTNAVRHGQATTVDVVLERRQNHLVVVIEDDGQGFDPDAVVTDGHLGLAGMRERAEQMGGTLVVESAPGAGATVFLNVPCDEG